MKDELPDNDYDLNQIIIKPLYFGLTVNILLPMVLFLICYYIQTHGGRDNLVGDFANPLFYIFAALALLQAALALRWRGQRFRQPMILSRETFEEDLPGGLLIACRPVFILISAISVYGLLYFFLTGRFTEMVVFVFFSFIVFQVVRPRHGMVRKVIARQEELVRQGQLRRRIS